MLDDTAGLPGRWIPPDALAGLPRELPAVVRRRGAFLSAPLPSEVVLRNETWTAAARAQESLGRLDAHVQEFPHATRWARQAFLREIHASARLENVTVPWREALVIDAAPPPLARTNRLFVGYRESGRRVADLAARGGAMTTDVLFRLSAMIAGNGEVGGSQWRTTPAWLGGPDPRMAVYLLAPPGPELMVATEQWCTWKHAQKSLPAAVKCAMLAGQFGLLSPFPGSAHLARLAIHHELVSSKILSAPLVPLSEWMDRKQKDLSRLLVELVGHGDFNDLVTFLATGIRATCKRETLLIKQTRKRTAERVAAIGTKSAAMVALVEALSVTPLMTLPHVADACEVSSSQAANLVRQLLDDGVVMSMDNESYQGLPGGIAYKRFIYIPEMIRNPLSTFPRTAP